MSSLWAVPRNLRYAIVITVLLLLVLIQFWSNILPVPVDIHNYIPHRNGTAPPSTQDFATDQQPKNPIDWSQYAYTQYVTNANYLCNSVMIFESLDRLDSKAERVMLYPQQWEVPGDSKEKAGYESELLARARDQYKVKLVPIQVQTFSDGADPTWQDSYTKLLAFNQTQYKRIINVDSDSTILKHMDELFFLPPAPVAMPRAFWLGDKPNFLSSQIIVIEPSDFEWKRIEQAIAEHKSGDFDMEIVNNLYGKSCLVLPHRRYDLTTGEFRSDNHEAYLGSNEHWDGRKIFDETKFLHFSDWPYPKPWISASEGQTTKMQPKCKQTPDNEDCTDRDIWLGIYKDFSQRRLRICGKEYDRRKRRSEPLQERPSKYEPIYPMN